MMLTQLAKISWRHMKLSRVHLPILLCGIVAVTLLLATHHHDVDPPTDAIDDAISNQVEIESVTESQSTIKSTTRSTTHEPTTISVQKPTEPAAQNDSQSLSRQFVREIIKSQGTFIPIVTNRTSSSTRPVSHQDVKTTLDILDKQIETSKKVLEEATKQTSAFYWNTTLPRQLLIVTSWRSGSTFLGEILANHPAIFHHYEPLTYFGAKQIRGGEEGVDAVGQLKSLLHCNYSNPHYLQSLRNRSDDMLSHNVQLWPSCRQSPHHNTCKTASFLHQACQRFPVIVAKTVRLRLALARQLIADPDLDRMKILYLIRDPRATMNSRFAVGNWCTLAEDCISPDRLCTDLLGDLESFEMLTVAYPGRLALVKYETLASEPHETFQEIFRFLNLPFLPSVNETLHNHTTSNRDETWSTFRQSTDRVELWKTNMNRTQIDRVQRYCSTVLDRLGYSLV